MRLIDADALAEDLLYDVELCSRLLDDIDIVGKDRERLQWEKDCKQNCVYYLTESPTIDAVPVIRCKDCKWGKEVCGNIECWTDMNLPPEYHGYYWYCPNGERKEE